MKYTHTATTSDPLPEFVELEEWMQKALKELSLKTLTPEQRMAYEMELARVGSRLGELKRHQKTLKEIELHKEELELHKEELELHKEELELHKEELELHKEEIKLHKDELTEKDEKLAEQGTLIQQQQQALEEKDLLAEQEKKRLVRSIWAAGSMTKVQIIELFNLNPEMLEEILKG